MGIRQKIIIPDSYYFVTFTFLDWTHICISERYFDLFYKWFDYQKEHYENRVYGYVIMPNHFHGLLYISETSPSLDKIIQNGKRFLAYGVVKLLKEDGRTAILEKFAASAKKTRGAKHRVFEPRYDAKLLDNERMILQKLQYIHNNPCKEYWQLASTPEGYRHSSAVNYTGEKGRYDVEILE